MGVGKHGDIAGPTWALPFLSQPGSGQAPPLFPLLVTALMVCPVL